jgi:ssDNA-binding replication factor A large subunit
MVSQILDSSAAIIKKIQEKGFTEQEIKEKVSKKQEEYGGLLTEAGAAYSIAKELGIDFDFEPKNEIKVKDLADGMANVNISATVDNAFPFREFEKDGRKGTVANFTISDDTGKINLVVWNKDPSVLGQINPGAKIRVLNAYARKRNETIEVNVGNLGAISVVSGGKDVDRRIKLKDLQNNSFAEIRATIVDVFKPTILEVCPNCGSMLKPDCPKCGKTEKAYSLIVNAELDDGTDVVRGTFYRAIGEKFLGLSAKELKDSQALFDDRRRKLLGDEYVFVGESRFDQAFNRMNFIIRSFNNIDIQKELAMVS